MEPRLLTPGARVCHRREQGEACQHCGAFAQRGFLLRAVPFLAGTRTQCVGQPCWQRLTGHPSPHLLLTTER
jgi:hypothetical protein